MDTLLIAPGLLAAFFFAVALAYSSVGLGGGSSYTALLAIFGASQRAIPTVSLTMNVVVTFVGSINYIRGGHLPWRLVATVTTTSVPMAYLGGRLSISPTSFTLLLMAMLSAVAFRIYFWKQPAIVATTDSSARLPLAALAGGLLGLLSGIVGIGGGILLVPIILVLGLASPKQAAATGSLFILLNSGAGLSAHLQRHSPPLTDLLPLLVAVFAGGLLGSYLGSTRLQAHTVQRLLGGIIVVAIIMLGLRLI